MKKSYAIVLVFLIIFLFVIISSFYYNSKQFYSPSEGIGYEEARRQCLSEQRAACYTLEGGTQCTCKYSRTTEQFYFVCCSGDERCSMEPDECRKVKNEFGNPLTAPCCIFELPRR